MANPSRFPTNPGQTPGEKGHETTSGLGQKTQETASDVTRRAQEAAGNVGQRAQEMASSARERTEEAISTVGDKMASLAGTIREKAPREGMLGTAAGAVADQLESGGRYLRTHGFGDMTDDLTALIRQHPMQALLVGLGVGFLVGMTLRRS